MDLISTLSNRYEDAVIVKQIWSQLDQPQEYKAKETLLSYCLYMIALKSELVIVTGKGQKSQRYYRKAGHLFYSYTNNNFIVNQLLKHGFAYKPFDVKPEDRTEREQEAVKKHKCTCLFAKDKLNFYLGKYLLPSELELRDTDKNPMWYDENDPKKKIMIERTKFINESISKYDFCDGDGNKLDTQETRIFNGDLRHGGRSYMSWQSKYNQRDNQERDLFTVNGVKLIGLDYDGFHINMLYHIKRKKYAGLDPFGDCFPNCKKNQSKALRSEVKVLFYTLINVNAKTPAQRRAQSCSAQRCKYKTQKSKSDGTVYYVDEEGKCKQYEDMLRDKFNVTIESMYDALISRHKPVEKYFASGFGLQQQAIESKIITEIRYQCAELDIPVLPMHDELLCRPDNRTKVKEIMHRVYKDTLEADVSIDGSFSTSESNVKVKPSYTVPLELMGNPNDIKTIGEVKANGTHINDVKRDKVLAQVFSRVYEANSSTRLYHSAMMLWEAFAV